MCSLLTFRAVRVLSLSFVFEMTGLVHVTSAKFLTMCVSHLHRHTSTGLVGDLSGVLQCRIGRDPGKIMVTTDVTMDSTRKNRLAFPPSVPYHRPVMPGMRPFAFLPPRRELFSRSVPECGAWLAA